MPIAPLVPIVSTPLKSSSIAGVDNTTANGVSNLRQGPASVFYLEIDNTVTNATKVWVKLYDDITTLVPGTTKPICIIPVKAVATSPARGLAQMVSDVGMSFRNGISILASKENGDTMTDPPATNIDLRVLTER